MRHVWALMSVVSLLGPCAKKDEAALEAGAASDAAAVAAADAAPAVVAEPVAKNGTKVGRFPNETKLGMEKEKLQADVTTARESPNGGPFVANLKKDVEVTKVASRGDYFLIAFTDPKDSASTLEGWINKSGFTPSPPGPKTAAPCPVKGQVRFAGAACKYDCSKDPCPAGMACTGMGSRPEISDGAFPYCEPTGGVADAGGAAPISCKGNLVLWTDNQCHTKCVTNKDCIGVKGVCTPIGNGVSACL